MYKKNGSYKRSLCCNMDTKVIFFLIMQILWHFIFYRKRHPLGYAFTKMY